MSKACADGQIVCAGLAEPAPITGSTTKNARHDSEGDNVTVGAGASLIQKSKR
jgi:hypothetical protein